MIDYVNNLKKEVDIKIKHIESAQDNVLKKSLEASRVIGEAFDKLKEFILAYTFKDDEEEILFFKELKPKFCYRLIFYRKIYNIEMNRPLAGIDAQREYLCKELNAINGQLTHIAVGDARVAGKQEQVADQVMVRIG